MCKSFQATTYGFHPGSATLICVELNTSCNVPPIHFFSLLKCTRATWVDWGLDRVFMGLMVQPEMLVSQVVSHNTVLFKHRSSRSASQHGFYPGIIRNPDLIILNTGLKTSRIVPQITTFTRTSVSGLHWTTSGHHKSVQTSSVPVQRSFFGIFLYYFHIKTEAQTR